MPVVFVAASMLPTPFAAVTMHGLLDEATGRVPVGLSLGDLSDLVADSRRLFNPAEWVGLQDKIKTKYSTREEIAMSDADKNGMPVQEAVDKYMAEMKEKSDDIELF